jgi:hypothetical protein
MSGEEPIELYCCEIESNEEEVLFDDEVVKLVIRTEGMLPPVEFEFESPRLFPKSRTQKQKIKK